MAIKIRLKERVIPTFGTIEFQVADSVNGLEVPMTNGFTVSINFSPLISVNDAFKKHQIERTFVIDSEQGDSQFVKFGKTEDGIDVIWFDGVNYFEFIGTYRIDIVDKVNALTAFATFDTYTEKVTIADIAKKAEWNYTRESLAPEILKGLYNDFISDLGMTATMNTVPIILNKVEVENQNVFQETQFYLPERFKFDRALWIYQNQRKYPVVPASELKTYTSGKQKNEEYWIDKQTKRVIVNSRLQDNAKLWLDYYKEPYRINTKIDLIQLDWIEFPYESEGVILFEYFIAMRYYMRIGDSAQYKQYLSLYEGKKEAFDEEINSENQNRILQNNYGIAWK